MTVDLSLVLVSYRSSPVLAGAVDTFRREAARAGVAAEIVVVDHSEDPEETKRAAELDVDRVLQRPNRGYAAGINVGLTSTRAPLVFVGNPDIRFLEGSVGELVSALESGWGIVGPLFELAGFVFPPADVQTPSAEAGRWLATLRRGWWQAFLRREMSRWERVWNADGPVEVPALSGALIAFSADTARRLGPWDEEYFLHFEETDWLRWARRQRLSIGQVPGARVEHRWGHATEPTLEETFSVARQRYYDRHFGRSGRLVTRLGSGSVTVAARPWPEGVEEVSETKWLVSPSPLGFPAALLRSESARIAPSVEAFAAAQSHPRTLTILAIDPISHRVRWVWRRQAG